VIKKLQPQKVTNQSIAETANVSEKYELSVHQVYASKPSEKDLAK